MVFNIASAALVYQSYQQSYQQNSTAAAVTYTEFALSITELVFICLNIFLVIRLIQKGAQIILSYSLLIVHCFNIAYSAYVIEYYNGNQIVTPFLNNVALAIIILNSLAICGCCIGSHYQVKEEPTRNTNARGDTWTLSQV
jgi:hypothetical protein